MRSEDVFDGGSVGDEMQQLPVVPRGDKEANRLFGVSSFLYSSSSLFHCQFYQVTVTEKTPKELKSEFGKEKKEKLIFRSNSTKKIKINKRHKSE